MLFHRTEFQFGARAPDYSARFHFNQIKDTLLIEYYPECWGDYPIKLENNVIKAFWNDNLDTKYEFDIVKVVHNNRTEIGTPFLSFSLNSDSTLNVFYLNKSLVNKINMANKNKHFLPTELTCESGD